MVLVALVVIAGAGAAAWWWHESSSSSSNAAPPVSPHLSRGVGATMHGDSEASDTVGVAGPGRGSAVARYVPLAADCPTILIGSDNLLQVVCVRIADRVPVAYLIDPVSMQRLASMPLVRSNLLGGIYSYLDDHDRLVVADGSTSLLVIAHSQSAAKWRFSLARHVMLDSALPAGDSVVGLTPSWDGLIWFASAHGVIGTVDSSGTVRSTRLRADETVANSIASAPGGVAVASTRALYLFTSASGAPKQKWRQSYDRGSARKPGQLSWGTGSTPTFFGPSAGSEFVTILDNADMQEHLLVFNSSSGSRVCSVAVLAPDGSGSENSPIGYGNRVYVADTYGYQYPAYPEGAGASRPVTAQFDGGLARVDVSSSGCSVKWTRPIRSASVPKLSRADGLIYTTTQTAVDAFTARFTFAVIDGDDGTVVSTTPFGTGRQYDPIQQAGAISHDGAYYQGVLTGLVRISRSP